MTRKLHHASVLDPAKQQENQQNDDHQTETATAVVACAIERSAAQTAESPQQRDHQNDQNNRTYRHRNLLSP